MMITGSRKVNSALMLIAASALVAACGSGSKGSSSTGATTPPASSASATTGSQATATRVTATLTEFRIALSRTAFTPGTYTFVTVNSGRDLHALEINGPGVENQKTGNLQPGQTADLTVTLQKGSYDVFCPVDSHKQLGMNLELQVTG
jgi:hypothetical protein